MKKLLHIWHEWESDGFENGGSYTTRFYKKCFCGARTYKLAGNPPPENLNMAYVFVLVPLWVFGLFAYIYWFMMPY
jgi:hypothetical protein